MRFRSLLVITALVSSILGAAVVWLVLTVPNDIAAESLLKDARRNIEAHDNDKARTALTKVVQEYPRTNAAAAATVALVALGDQDRQKLAAEIDTLRRDQQTQMASMQQKLDKLAATPPPAPAPAPVVTAPPPPPPAPKKAPAKPSVKHKKSRKQRR